MTDTSSKVRHVLAARQSRTHTCHWPGCLRQVPPALWGCRDHWYRLPLRFRRRIWATYRIGQEDTRNVSDTYLQVAREIQEWIKSSEGHL